MHHTDCLHVKAKVKRSAEIHMNPPICLAAGAIIKDEMCWERCHQCSLGRDELDLLVNLLRGLITAVARIGRTVGRHCFTILLYQSLLLPSKIHCRSYDVPPGVSQ